VLCGLLALVAVALAFGLPGHAAPAPAAAVRLPAAGYYLPDYASWVGRRYQDLDVAGFVVGAPADLAVGVQYVVFYRKDCDHCHDLLDAYFAGDLPVPTTAVAVPERNGFPTAGVKPMPCTQCRFAQLPTGCDWFMKTPVLVRLNNGLVECAAEVDVDDPQCLQP
jgi:hypothetical protein